MKRYQMILTMLFLGFASAGAQPRIELTIDNAWKFLRANAEGAQAINYADSRWDRIALPHTWNAQDGQDGGNDYYRGVGWYRKELKLDRTLRGRSLFLKFDGVSTAAQVFVNGTLVGTHKGAFSACCFDVTSMVTFNRPTVIAVKVSNARDTTIAPLRGDFTIFGGIYRSVHLLALDSISISPLDHASPGVYVRQVYVDAQRAELDITAVTRNAYPVMKEITLRCTVKDGSQKVVQTAESAVAVPANVQKEQIQRITLAAPHLWQGREDPYLYSVVVEVVAGGKVRDRIVQSIGLRSFSIDPEKGFFLNGKPYALHGVNRHQDRETMGWAIGLKEHQEDFALIQDIGATAVRLAHYQHGQEFYDLCDRGGMVVWAELALVDEISQSPEFGTLCRQQLTELIKQSFNHPSIMFWSIYNELMPEPNRGLYGKLVLDLNTLAKQLDSTRLTVMASRSKYDLTEYINTVTDVLGYNVYKGWYEGKPESFAAFADSLHRRFPERRVCISEYGAGAGTTQHEYPPSRPNTKGPWHPEEWQSRLHEVTWMAMAERPFLWGTFVWNMFDFASDGRSEGELAGRNDKGLVTFDRKIKKDAFYWYRANWNPEPMVYITSRRFTPRPAGPTDVRVYANCDSVALSINGTAMGSRSDPSRLFVWAGVELTNGANVVEAVGFKNGKRVKDTCTWMVPMNEAQKK